MTSIAFVSTLQLDEPWGGSEELWSQTAARLRTKGWSVHASVHRFSEVPAPVERLRRAGVQVTFRQPGSLKERVLRHFDSNRRFRWLDRVRPQLTVISQGCNLEGADWMVACHERRLPYVVIAHAAIDTEFPVQDRAEMALLGYTHARAAYFVSQGNVRTTQRQLGDPLTHAVVVRNPYKVDYDASPPWPNTAGFRLACVGRLHPFAKGQDLLLDLMDLPKWRQRPISLTFFGKGPYQYAIERRLREQKLDNVRIGGYVDGIESIWAEHHALVLPSRFEGLPLAIVEAMLCARPCIVTDVAGNAELLEDGRTGFVARGPYLEALDEAMERAWERRLEWRRMGEAAQVAVRQQVPRDPIAAFVEELKSHIGQ